LLLDGILRELDALDEEVTVDAEGRDDVVLGGGRELHVADHLRVAAEQGSFAGVLVKDADLARAEAVADVPRVDRDLAELPVRGGG